MQNLILLIDDNHRADHVGCYGGHASTPTWDAIASRGVRFTNLRTVSPVCSPARAALQTGCQPQQAGITHVLPSWTHDVDGGGALREPIHRKALPQYLQPLGYECMYAGKWHIGDENVGALYDRSAATDTAARDYSTWCAEQGLPEGFIFHDPARSKPFRYHEPPHMTVPHCQPLDIPAEAEHNRWMLDHALQLLREHDPNKPLFFTFSTYGVHPPLAIPEPWYSMYDPADMVKPDNWGASGSEPAFLKNSYFRRLFDHFGDDFDLWRKPLAVGLGYVSYIDHLFGEFLDAARELGVLDDAVVAMTSDHGEMFGQHGLWQKFCPYEEALRVPWVMQTPGASGVCNMDVSTIDIAPTLLGAIGVETDMEGENLLPYVTGKKQPPATRDCFSQHNRPPAWRDWQDTPDWRCIVRRPWKYVLHSTGEEELYDWVNDAGEEHNRAADALDIMAELRAALEQWMTHTGGEFTDT